MIYYYHYHYRRAPGLFIVTGCKISENKRLWNCPPFFYFLFFILFYLFILFNITEVYIAQDTYI